MDETKKEFLTHLHETFRIEAGEHLRAISAGLTELERAPEAKKFREIVETVFRETHSLKGAARSVDFREVVSVCQPLESVLSAVKRGEITVSLEILDLAHEAINVIEGIISSKQEGALPAGRPKIRNLVRKLGAVTPESAYSGTIIDPSGDTEGPDGDEEEEERAPRGDNPMKVDSVRISTSTLDRVLLQAEEMIMLKMISAERVGELKGIGRSIAKMEAQLLKRRDRVRREPGAHDTMPEWDWDGYNTLRHRITAVIRGAEHDHRAMQRMIDDHLESMKQVMMLPVSSLVEVFPKMVRDMARDQGKEAELIIHGGDLEIDRRILEEMKDPLVHLLRNSIYHGITRPEERARAHKVPKGIINLSFEIKDGRRIEVMMSDDGEGVDTERVRNAAVKNGVLREDAAAQYEQRDIVQLIFQSGLTTSPIITDISGRGLGLAIVKDKVEKLGGTITCESAPGSGVSFILSVPLSLATFRGVLVRVDDRHFIVPSINVECTKRVERSEIRTIENRETIQLNGRNLSLVRLRDVLELPARGAHRQVTETPHVFAVVAVFAGVRIALQVDEIIHEQQIVLKNLGNQLSRVRNIAGASIMGNGTVVPVLNVSDLVKSAVRTSSAPEADISPAQPEEKQGRILVAEDSITARALLKNILETAGYEVATAVDGMDALTRVRSEVFDLVVSDVDMPRMNGFELTAGIRSTKNAGNLPVVLVTALESGEDRERGIEAGANAYIVKSSFDQSNLLEVVKRLI